MYDSYEAEVTQDYEILKQNKKKTPKLKGHLTSNVLHDITSQHMGGGSSDVSVVSYLNTSCPLLEILGITVLMACSS